MSPPEINWHRIPLLGKDPRPASSSDSISLEEFIEGCAFAPGAVALDYETNGEDVRDGTGYTQGLSICYRHTAFGLVKHYLPFRHKYGFNLDPKYIDMLNDTLRFRDSEAKLPIVMHNSKADLEFGDNLGIKIVGTSHYCTMLMAHLINEILPYNKSLDGCTAYYLKIEGKKSTPEFKRFIEKFGWGAIPSEEMFEYGVQDAILPLHLFEHLWPMFCKENLHDVWESKKRVITAFRSMERTGILINTSLCEKMIAIGEGEMDDVVQILGLNPGSPKDLKKLLLDELGLPVLKRSVKTNAPSFDKEVMEVYEDILSRTDDYRAFHILNYRGWQKAVSSSYRPYVKLLSSDGRLRCNYKLHGTKTGRCSCENPNLQQIPKISMKPWNGEMKQCFIEIPGFILIEADYSQLEFRLSTSKAYANEPSLIEIFEDDSRDVFAEMVEVIGLVRGDTKTFVYATGYGAGINRLHHALGVSTERATEIRQDYWTAYPGIRRMTNYAAARAKTQRKVRIWSGRYRHFFDPLKESHKAFNSVIQGGAADIVERAQCRVFEELDGGKSPEFRMLLQVHDALVFRIAENKLDHYTGEIKRIMEDVQTDFGVRFKVDIKRWGT